MTAAPRDVESEKATSGWRGAAGAAWRRVRGSGGHGGRKLRWLRIVVLVAVGFFVLYLIAANVILRTRLLRGWLNGNEDKLRVEYGSAWSGYPGHVAVRDLTVRYQDSRVQMFMRFDRATLRIDNYALTQKAVRISKLDAEVATFRLRNKMESAEGREGRLAAFPPIEGFADPPIEKKVKKPPIPEEEYDLWTIELADITANVREVWTMEYRYRGESTLAGAFHVKPKREVWIRPSVMVTHGGVLSLGDRELIRGGEGRLEAQMDAFDVREGRGMEVLRHFSARVHQDGEVVSLGALGATYLAGSPVVLDGGKGSVIVDIVLDHGVFQPGSRATYKTSEAVVRGGGIEVRSDINLAGHVAPGLAGPSVRVEATIAQARVTPQMDVRGIRAGVDLGNADLTAPFELAHLSGAVKSAHVANLRAWQAVAPEKMSFEGGAATLSANAEYHGGALEGRFDLDAEKTRMTMGTFAIACSGKIASNVASADASRSIALPGASADLRDIGLRLQSGQTDGLWMKARFDKALLTTSGAVGFDSDIAVESGPGDRTVQLFTRMASLPDVAADVTAGSQLSAALKLRVRPKDVALTVVQAKNGAIDTRGRIRKRGDAGVTGAFLVGVGPIKTGLDIHEGVSVHPFAGGGWLEEKLLTR